MSDQPSRSAPLLTILVVLAGFALFVVVAWYAYIPRQTGPFTDDGIHTREQRKANRFAVLLVWLGPMISCRSRMSICASTLGRLNDIRRHSP